jgi:hypothetical protein
MSSIRLDLQRRCEQRWAAQHPRPAEPATNPKHRFEEQHRQPATPSKGERKTRRLSSAGSKSAPAA